MLVASLGQYKLIPWVLRWFQSSSVYSSFLRIENLFSTWELVFDVAPRNASGNTMFHVDALRNPSDKTANFPSTTFRI